MFLMASRGEGGARWLMVETRGNGQAEGGGRTGYGGRRKEEGGRRKADGGMSYGCAVTWRESFVDDGRICAA